MIKLIVLKSTTYLSIRTKHRCRLSVSVFLFLLSVCQAASMMRKDVNKPKGKTSAYAFFVQTCREEHRKKNPEQSVNFAEFSKKCSERWKVRDSY